MEHSRIAAAHSTITKLLPYFMDVFMVFYSHTIRLRTAYDTPVSLYPLTETAFLANRHHITTHPFSQLKAFLCLILSFPPLSSQRPPLLPQLFMKVKCHFIHLALSSAATLRPSKQPSSALVLSFCRLFLSSNRHPANHIFRSGLQLTVFPVHSLSLSPRLH